MSEKFSNGTKNPKHTNKNKNDFMYWEIFFNWKWVWITCSGFWEQLHFFSRNSYTKRNPVSLFKRITKNKYTVYEILMYISIYFIHKIFFLLQSAVSIQEFCYIIKKWYKYFHDVKMTNVSRSDNYIYDVYNERYNRLVVTKLPETVHCFVRRTYIFIYRSLSWNKEILTMAN